MVNNMNTSEIITIVALVVSITTAIFSIVLYLNSRQRKFRNEEKLNRAELSHARERIERQIYELNEKLYSDSERWKNVNHLLINNLDKERIKVSNKPFDLSFFENMGLNINDISVEKDLVFFLTPFHNDFEKEYHYVSTVCNDMGLKCTRGDETFVEGNILKYILQRIMSSSIVIANLNGRNPNVYYELGIAHALGKPVILISNENSFKQIPFDLQSNRLIIYKNQLELKKSLTNALARTLIESK